MQVKEKIQRKKRGEPGFVVKRVLVPTEINKKVDWYLKKMCVRELNNSLTWQEAFVELMSKATSDINLNDTQPA